MPETAANPSGDSSAASEHVNCSKCGAENSVDAHRCSECDAHLYVRCHYCRQRVERSLPQCPACGKMMKAPLLWRLKRSLRGGNAALIWMVPAVILFLVLGILIASHFTPAEAQPPAGPNKLPVRANSPPAVSQGSGASPARK